MVKTKFKVGDQVFLCFNPNVKMTIVTIVFNKALVVYSSDEFRQSNIYPLEVLVVHKDNPMLITI